MPFKRAGWLQRGLNVRPIPAQWFQCPLSGLVGCNPLLSAWWKVAAVFQCPLSGLVGCNTHENDNTMKQETVSMPFKRAGWLQHGASRGLTPTAYVSMPFKRAGWLQRSFV